MLLFFVAEYRQTFVKQEQASERLTSLRRGLFVLVALMVYLAVTVLQISIERFLAFLFFTKMKQIFLFFFSLVFSVNVYAGWKYNIVIDGTNSSTYRDSIVSISFSLYDNCSFLHVMISNNTNERIAVEWENAKIFGDQVCFDNDSRLTMGRAKQDEVIMKGDYISKNLLPKGNVLSSRVMPLFQTKPLKKGETRGTYVTIPVKYKGKTYDIEIQLTASAVKE